MKKTILSVLIALCFSLSAYSQFYVGPKVGMNLNSFVYNYKNSGAEPVPRVSVGPTFGVLFHYQFNDVVGLRTGISYASKGTAIDVNESFEYLDTLNYYRDGFQRYTLNYIEIPFEGTFGFRFEDHNIFGSVGPYLAFFIYGKNRWNYDKFLENPDGSKVLIDSYNDSRKVKPKSEVTNDDLFSDEEFINPVDLGINFGLGYQVMFFVVNVQYGMGLINLTPKYTMISDFNKDRKKFNRVISINFTFLFGGKTKNSTE